MIPVFIFPISLSLMVTFDIVTRWMSVNMVRKKRFIKLEMAMSLLCVKAVKPSGSNYTGRLMKFLLVLLFCLPHCVPADIYQWQDVSGTKHFSDRSHPQAKILEIKPGYGFYTVIKVFDGDTVVLSNGRKVRLLGINTPEVRHRDKVADAGGDEAKQWLKNKLLNNKVRLVTDAEKTDKYGRTLAHLFTEKKEHINLELVKAGLAEVSIYPPNLLYVDELLKAQDLAEQHQLGLWQREEYAVKPASSLIQSEHTGWTRVVDKVTHIREARKFVYLEFSSQFEVRIKRQWLSLFPDINEYPGKSIEARGWLNKNRDGFSMLIRHPSALKYRGS
jgi:endonuclease YncB( thermonuclease family)